MLSFHVESWSAIAPGLESRDDWECWLQHPVAINEPLGKIPLKTIPAMLRRRFNTLGKCAMGAAMPLVDGIHTIPSIFASRHGDTELTFSLLKAMAQDEPMSPTGFSLAVHNAVSGLFSIARKDTSEVTSIAAMEGLVLQTFFEAIGQLQCVEKVLCVIYDTPLPDFYKNHCADATESFPYAIAMILGSREGTSYSLEQMKAVPQRNSSDLSPLNSDPLALLGLLAGISDEIELTQNGGNWRFSRLDSKC
jgi:hypothetical protein